MTFGEAQLRSLMEAAVEAFNRRDLHALWGEVREFHLLPEMPDARTLHGREETIAYFKDLLETVPDWHVELLDVLAAPPFGIARYRGTGSSATSGARSSAEWTEVYEIDDLANGPRVVRQFSDHEDALRAAGIRSVDGDEETG